MKYQLFIADFDGTLGCAPDVIERQTVETIKEYERRGGIFCIVTGRSYTSIKSICDKYALSGITACFQGARIVDTATGEEFFNGGLNPKLANQIVNQLEKDGILSIAWIDDTLVYSQDSYYTEMYQKLEKVKINRVESVGDEILAKNMPVSKICACCEAKELPILLEKYCKLYGKQCIINSGMNRLLEFINPSCNKGLAVKFIAEKLKISLDKVLVVGDSSNDIEMFKGSWHTVAVGDAVLELKQVAKEITVPFKEQPVKALLEKYCL